MKFYDAIVSKVKAHVNVSTCQQTMLIITTVTLWNLKKQVPIELHHKFKESPPAPDTLTPNDGRFS